MHDARHQTKQVMEQIGERTRDYIQANAGVELTRKLGTDAKMTPQELALIVKQLPVRIVGKTRSWGRVHIPAPLTRPAPGPDRLLYSSTARRHHPTDNDRSTGR